MPSRDLPAGLRSALMTASTLEAHADTPARRRRAIAATSRLLLAAHHAGWRQRELAAFLQWPRQTVQLRIAVARRAGADATAGLDIERPPASASSRRRDVLQRPVTEREWLTLTEAATHVDRHEATVLNWLARGVLPNTDRRSRAWYMYSRADLDRVMAAPRRGRRQRYPDFAWLLAQTAPSAAPS